MPEPSRHKRIPADFALWAGILMAGLGIGAWLRAGAECDALLAMATGLLLVVAFRLYETRAAEQERRLEMLQAEHNHLALERAALERLHATFAETVGVALSGTEEGAGHYRRIQRLCVQIGREMGLDENALAGLGTAALLHDIGRSGVPPHIWAIPGALSETEWDRVRRHPRDGAARLLPVAFPWPVAEVVRAHRERWDGAGYPDGLSGSAIPLAARILSLADAYDALTSPRPYRPAMRHAEAMRTLMEEAGTRYDPAVVAAFQRITGRGEFMDMAMAASDESVAP